MGAGYETTVTSMGLILFELATHPDEQSRLREEVCAARAADALEDAGAINLETLPVLSAVIKVNPTFLPAIPCSKTRVFFIGISTIPLFHIFSARRRKTKLSLSWCRSIARLATLSMNCIYSKGHTSSYRTLRITGADVVHFWHFLD